MLKKAILFLVFILLFSVANAFCSQTLQFNIKYINGKEYTGENSLGKSLRLTSLDKMYTLEKRPMMAPNSPDFPEIIAFPYETYVKAYILKNNQIVKEIKEINDFKGYVSIDTVEKAIEFVRFRTSMQTYFLFSPSIFIEVFNKDLQPQDKNMFGACNGLFFKKNKLSNLRIKEKDSYFEINRYLIFYPWPNHKTYPASPILYNSTEKVFKDGGYSIILKEILLDFKYSDISYPLEPS